MISRNFYAGGFENYLPFFGDYFLLYLLKLFRKTFLNYGFKLEKYDDIGVKST